jgi:membrane associated rhomboid family serine protease
MSMTSPLLLPEVVLLLAGALVALQLVSVLLRGAQARSDEAPYLALLAIDLLAILYVHATHRHDTRFAFVAEAVAVVLTLGLRLVEGLERRAVARDDLRAAARIAAWRELIAPGRASAAHRRRLSHLAEARGGGAAAVVRQIAAAADAERDPARAAALHEELATVLILDGRHGEAIDYVEAHLSLPEVARRPVFAAYLVRALGEVGELGRAATVLTLLEEAVAGDPAAAGLLLQARLTFLAYAGAAEPLEALLRGPVGRMLPQRAHTLLLTIARARASAPREPDVAAAIEAAAARLGEAGRVRPRRASPVTAALIAVNVTACLACALFVGGDDEAALIRAGALFRPAVLAGEWWRAFSAQFLHAGLVHLAVNMYGLYLLGRFSEDVLGSGRYLIVYLVGGLMGAAASTGVSAGGLSVGASGAIMGLLGALIVLLVLRRGSWPEAWRRALLWNLVFLGALQIYIGFQVSMIDNAAHVGGMLGGAVAALVVAPGLLLGRGRVARAAVSAVAALLIGLLVASFVLVARTSLPTTLERLHTRQVEVGGVLLTVPRYWDADVEHGRVEDPYLGVQVSPVVGDLLPRVESPQADDPRYRALIARIAASARAP